MSTFIDGPAAGVSLMLGRFLGVAKEAPTNGGTKLVDLGAFNVRG